MQVFAALSEATKESSAFMVFAEDTRNPEGPVALADGTWLIVEGSTDRGCVTHLSPDGKTRRTIRKTGRPNGLAIDADGAIFVAESKVPSLLRLTMDGECQVVATEWPGRNAVPHGLRGSYRQLRAGWQNSSGLHGREVRWACVSRRTAN
jgi:hypothetical protein